MHFSVTSEPRCPTFNPALKWATWVDPGPAQFVLTPRPAVLYFATNAGAGVTLASLLMAPVLSDGTLPRV